METTTRFFSIYLRNAPNPQLSLRNFRLVGTKPMQIESVQCVVEKWRKLTNAWFVPKSVVVVRLISISFGWTST